MKVLIYGAGVIGSVFAGKLAQSGQDVTVLARGKRLAELKENGIILIRPGRREETFQVKLTETLSPDDLYDYIIVAMQKTQVVDVLPALSQNKSPNIIFVVNTASGYESWAKAIGVHRLMIGFPSAGGERVNGRVVYFVGKGLMRGFQTTTFSDYSGGNSERLRKVVKAFRQAGIPSVTCENMDFWQKTHVAMVTSIGNALYKYGSDNYALSKSYRDVRLMICGIKEGLAVLKKLGIKITPSKLNFYNLPTPLLAAIFKVILGTKLAETTMAKHTAAAKPEMVCLQREFDALIQKSGLPTPSIDELREYVLK